MNKEEIDEAVANGKYIANIYGEGSIGYYKVYSMIDVISKLQKENEQLRDIKNKAIGHINACKTNLGNYVLSPSEMECLLEILKEEEND